MLHSSAHVRVCVSFLDHTERLTPALDSSSGRSACANVDKSPETCVIPAAKLGQQQWWRQGRGGAWPGRPDPTPTPPGPPLHHTTCPVRSPPILPGWLALPAVHHNTSTHQFHVPAQVRKVCGPSSACSASWCMNDDIEVCPEGQCPCLCPAAALVHSTTRTAHMPVCHAVMLCGDTDMELYVASIFQTKRMQSLACITSSHLPALQAVSMA